MATESSAIVRFIELQQQKPIAAVALPEPTDPLTDPFTPVRTRPVSLLVIGALLLFGGLAAGGIYLAKDVLFNSGGSGGGSAAAGAATDTDRGDEQEPARGVAGDPADNADRAMAQDPAKQAVRGVAMDPIPQPSAKIEPLSANPAVEPEAAAESAATSADTGFDLRVEPAGARVFLDGKALGVAPLRARNVASGAHTIDVEGPDGYFSKRLEVNVVLDKPQDLRVELAALEPSAEPVAAPRPDNTPVAAVATDDAAKEIKKLSKREQRRLARREARHEKRRLAREARQAKREAREAVKAEKAEKAERAEKAEPPKVEDNAEQKAALAQLQAGQSGTLRLGAKPPCDIYIDGKNTGMKTPQRSIRLSVGKHKVKLVNKEHGISSGFRVKIGSGKTTTVIRDLTDKMK